MIRDNHVFWKIVPIWYIKMNLSLCKWLLEERSWGDSDEINDCIHAKNKLEDILTMRQK